MEVYVPAPARFLEAPRSTWAPWLSPEVRRYELLEDFIVWVDGLRFVVPKGYLTDLASIPRKFHWLFPPSYRPSLHAAIWHDRAYSHWYKWMTKDYADKVFRLIMLHENAMEPVADAFYMLVHRFGKGGWYELAD